jgi:thiol-disulfide isomerase/thioredoxin
MSSLTAIAIITGVLFGSVIIGLICMRAQSRVRSIRSGRSQLVTSGDLGLPSEVMFGEEATLVQFSTQFCSKCPATARLLNQETVELDGVAYVEIDLTDNLEVAKRFNVLQTPTILVLDGSGHLRTRITGAPTAAVIREELGKIDALPYNIVRSEFAS